MVSGYASGVDEVAFFERLEQGADPDFVLEQDEGPEIELIFRFGPNWQAETEAPEDERGSRSTPT